MFAILCRRRLRVPSKCSVFVDPQFWAPQNAVSFETFSSGESSPSVCKNDSEKSFAVSYLINSCGLSSNDAMSVSNKVAIKSPKQPDAVLKLLREYGFTDAHIHRIVTKWPDILSACPNKTLLPKLEFFRSVGVPLPVLAQNLCVYPFVLRRSLENFIIPYYNELSNLLQSDEGVVHVLLRDPVSFRRCWAEGTSSNISMLRERGVPESSIVTLVMYKPSLLIIDKEKLAGCIDRAVEMGFDTSKTAFINAIRVFIGMTESTLKHKMEIYRRCGWSDSDIIAAFLSYPLCMSLSEKKIMDTMDFLVTTLGYKPVAIAECPRLLSYSLDKRIKPRCLVVGILNRKGLLTSGMNTLLAISEEKFLKSYIVKYEKDIPGLLDIYRGKLSPPEMKCVFSQVVSK